VISAPGRWTGQGANWLGSYFFTASENRRLRVQLEDMRRWRDTALALKDQNERYQALLGLKINPPIPMVAARVVSDARGPFSNARLADAGEERGVVVGNPVITERGLVGRVVGVARGASRVLLLSDTASRTPVMIDRTNARAILTGDGGPNPKLEYLRGREPVKPGDRVVTSGDGGVVPRGLPVGVAVKGIDGRWRVALSADSSAIDFVQILKFVDFAQLADQQALSAIHVPPVTTENPQQSILGPVRPAAPTAPAAGAAAAPAIAALPSTARAAAPPPTATPRVTAPAPAAPAPAPAAPAPR
jgi:rod shape-determining protein MreC